MHVTTQLYSFHTLEFAIGNLRSCIEKSFQAAIDIDKFIH